MQTEAHTILDNHAAVQRGVCGLFVCLLARLLLLLGCLSCLVCLYRSPTPPPPWQVYEKYGSFSGLASVSEASPREWGGVWGSVTLEHPLFSLIRETILLVNWHPVRAPWVWPSDLSLSWGKGARGGGGFSIFFRYLQFFTCCLFLFNYIRSPFPLPPSPWRPRHLTHPQQHRRQLFRPWTTVLP